MAIRHSKKITGDMPVIPVSKGIRPSHKQHVGSLPDDVSRGLKLYKSVPLFLCDLLPPRVLAKRDNLLYTEAAFAPRISYPLVTSAVTMPRQLAPTVGP